MDSSFRKNLGKVTPRTVVQNNLRTLDPEDTPAALSQHSSRKRSLRSGNKRASTSTLEDSSQGRATDKAKRKKLKNDDSIDKFHLSSADTSVLNFKGMDQTFANISAGEDSSLSETSIDLQAAAKFRRQTRTALKQSLRTSKNKAKVSEKTMSDVNKEDQTFDGSINKFHLSSADKSVLNFKGMDQTYANSSAGEDSSLSETSINLQAASKFRRQTRTALKQSLNTSKNKAKVSEKTMSDVNKGDQTFEHINYSDESSFEASLISRSSIRSSKRSKLNALSAEVTYANINSNDVDSSMESISLDNAKFTGLRNRVRGAALTSFNTSIPSVLSSQDISEQTKQKSSAFSVTKERLQKRGDLRKDLQSRLLEESVGKDSLSYIEDPTSSDLEDGDTTLDSIQSSARQLLSQRAPAIQLNVSSILKRIKTKPFPETIVEEEALLEPSGEKGEEIRESLGRSQSRRISEKDNIKSFQETELNRSEKLPHETSAGSLLPPPNFRDADNAGSVPSSLSISFSNSSSSGISLVRSNISNVLSELNEISLEDAASEKSATVNVGGESKKIGSDERTEVPTKQSLRSRLEGSLQTVDPQRKLGYSPRGQNHRESLDDVLKTSSTRISMLNREESPSPHKSSPRKSIAESNISPLPSRLRPRISPASKDRTLSARKVTVRKSLSEQRISPLPKNFSPRMPIANKDKTPSPSKHSPRMPIANKDKTPSPSKPSPRKSMSRQNTPTPSKVIQLSDSSLQNSMRRSSPRKKASLSNASKLDSSVPVASRSSLKSIVLSPLEVQLHPEEAIRAQQKLEQIQIDMAEREGSDDTDHDETSNFEGGSGEESEKISYQGLNKESSLTRNSSNPANEGISSSFTRVVALGNYEASTDNSEDFVTEDEIHSGQHKEATELPHVTQNASLSHDVEEGIDNGQSLNSSHAADLVQQSPLTIHPNSKNIETATAASPDFMYLYDEADSEEEASPTEDRESRNAAALRIDTHQNTEIAETSDARRTSLHKTGDPNRSNASIPEKFVTNLEPESGETSSDEELNLIPLIIRRSQATEYNDSSISNSSIIDEEVEMPQVTEEANVSERVSDKNEATQSGTVSETPRTKQMTLREYLLKLSTRPTENRVSDIRKPKPEITQLLKGATGSISKSAPKRGKKPEGPSKKKIELPKSVPSSLTREIFTHYAKCKPSKEVHNYVLEVAERFWKNTTDDLINIAQGRKGSLTITKEHVVKLMKRQGVVNSPLDLRRLIEENLPAEAWDHLLPTAYAHNKVYPPPDN